MSLQSLLWFSLSVTAPSFGQVLFGMVLRRFRLLTEAHVQRLSRLMFLTGMPAVMFLTAAGVDLHGALQSRYLIAGMVSTVLTTGLALAYARWRGFSLPHSGIMVQGAYRSNMGFIGLALCASAFGAEGLRLAALPLAVWTTFYNIIAVWLLNHTHGRAVTVQALLRGMLTNPLILSISAGLLLSASGLTLPAALVHAGQIFTGVFLPCVLVMVGAALSMGALRSASAETIDACVWKLLLMPALSLGVALLMGVRGNELAVLFLLLASPTATASFIMVAGVGGNVAMAANIVVLTTVLSAVTITVGLFVLQVLGLV